jgi:putative ABC transport system permease protein
VLVTAQISLTAMLLIGAALVGRSLLRLLNERPGFVTDHVLTMRVPLAGAAYQESTAQQRFFETLMARIRALPGVRQVGAITNLPLNGGSTLSYRVEGQPEPRPSARPEVVPRGVAGDYFAALRIPLVEGRVFDARDDSATPRVVIINRSLARQLFPAGSAIGRKMRFYAFPERPWSIVGVVGDVKTGALDAAPPPTVYYSHLQAAENRLTLAIRGTIEPSVLTHSVRAAVQALDPALPVYQVATMADVVSGAQPAQVRRYALLLLGAFAVTALLLAVVGIYGTVALSVTQRSRELGIRAALGATRPQLVSLALRHTAWLVVTGIAAGGILALGFGRFMRSLLYATSGTDPLTYFGVLLCLGALALVASVVPARRAARTDPAAILRAE